MSGVAAVLSDVGGGSIAWFFWPLLHLAYEWRRTKVSVGSFLVGGGALPSSMKEGGMGGPEGREHQEAPACSGFLVAVA
jgi:hypothetical protein